LRGDDDFRLPGYRPKSLAWLFGPALRRRRLWFGRWSAGERTDYENATAWYCPNPGIRRITVFTCSAVMTRVHSNCRGVSAWRGHHRKSLGSNRCPGSFQQLLHA